MGEERSIVNQLNVALPYDPAFCGAYTQKNWKQVLNNSNKKLCTNAHSITIPNSQKLKTTQMSIKGSLGKQSVLIHNAILFRHKRESSINTCYKVDELISCCRWQFVFLIPLLRGRGRMYAWGTEMSLHAAEPEILAALMNSSNQLP